ncbi:hypothetical protein VNO80_03323 [Phaseolus coccineus]|uniref:Uncharacterized protein n=1 Tax=Phaseolus coccineus TaxID=3886 RepID=A0AAN9NSY3_PHACN
MVPSNPHSTFSHNPCLKSHNLHSTFSHKPYLEPHTPTALQNPSHKSPFNLKQWPNALTNPHPSATSTAASCSPNTSFLHNPYLEPYTTTPLQHPSPSNTPNPKQEPKECEEPNECECPPTHRNTPSLVAHTAHTTTEHTQLRPIECPAIQTPPGAHFGDKVVDQG